MKKEITLVYKNQWQKVCAVKLSKKRNNRITGVPYLGALRTTMVFTCKHELGLGRL